MGATDTLESLTGRVNTTFRRRLRGTSNLLTEVLLALFLAGVALALSWLPATRRGRMATAAGTADRGADAADPGSPTDPPDSGELARPTQAAGRSHRAGPDRACRRWTPLPVTPAHTFASLLAIVSELLLFLAAARPGPAGRMKLRWS